MCIMKIECGQAQQLWATAVQHWIDNLKLNQGTPLPSSCDNQLAELW